MTEKFITKEDNKIKIFGVEFYYLWLLGILFALIGFLGENLFKAIDDGFIDSRFHVLPFIGCYALVPFAVHIALGDCNDLTFFGHKIFKEKNLKNKILSNILCFVIISGFVMAGELAIGNMWELCFGVELWNYSDMWGHLTQYSCPLATFGFGTLAFLCFKFIFNPLLNFFRNHIPYKVAKYICLSLGVFIILDEIRMMIQIMVTKKCPQFWKLVIYKK